MFFVVILTYSRKQLIVPLERILSLDVVAAFKFGANKNINHLIFYSPDEKEDPIYDPNEEVRKNFVENESGLYHARIVTNFATRLEAETYLVRRRRILPAVYNPVRLLEPVLNQVPTENVAVIPNEDVKPGIIHEFRVDSDSDSEEVEFVSESRPSNNFSWVSSKNPFQYMPAPLTVKVEHEEEEEMAATTTISNIESVLGEPKDEITDNEENAKNSSKIAEDCLDIVLPVPINSVKDEGFLWLPVPEPNTIKEENSLRSAASNNYEQASSSNGIFDSITGNHRFESNVCTIVHIKFYFYPYLFIFCYFSFKRTVDVFTKVLTARWMHWH